MERLLIYMSISAKFITSLEYIYIYEMHYSTALWWNCLLHSMLSPARSTLCFGWKEKTKVTLAHLPKATPSAVTPAHWWNWRAKGFGVVCGTAAIVVVQSHNFSAASSSAQGCRSLYFSEESENTTERCRSHSCAIYQILWQAWQPHQMAEHSRPPP